MTQYMISTEKFWDDISRDLGDRAGIYYLRSLNSDGSSYRPVPRVLQTDTDGVLYIGCSKEVRGRVGTLKKALCAAAGAHGYIDPYAHPAGRHYSEVARLRELYPFESLCITITPVPRETDHYRAEYDALRDYRASFGEVPPFNER